MNNGYIMDVINMPTLCLDNTYSLESLYESSEVWLKGITNRAHLNDATRKILGQSSLT